MIWISSAKTIVIFNLIFQSVAASPSRSSGDLHGRRSNHVEPPFSVGFTSTDFHLFCFSVSNENISFSCELYPEHQSILQRSEELQLTWILANQLKDEHKLLNFTDIIWKFVRKRRQRQILRLLFLDIFLLEYVYRAVARFDDGNIIQIFYPVGTNKDVLKIQFFRQAFVILPITDSSVSSNVYRYRYFTPYANRSEPEPIQKSFLETHQEILDEHLTLLGNWSGTKYYLDKMKPSQEARILDIQAPIFSNSTSLDKAHTGFMGVHRQLVKVICEKFNATLGSRLEDYSSFADLDSLFEAFSTRQENFKTNVPVNIVKVKWESIFLERKHEFLMLYCEPQLRLSTSSMSYWRGPYTWLTWLGILAAFCLFTGLVKRPGDDWEITMVLGGLARMLLRQGITKWRSKWHVIIALCCIVIHVVYEGEFTSQITQPPPPILIEDLKELLESGYKFLINPDELRSYYGPRYKLNFSQEGGYYAWTYITRLRPEAFQEFQKMFDLPMIETPSSLNRIVPYFEFVAAELCGRASEAACLNHPVENFALIMPDSQKLATLDWYGRQVSSKYCHFVVRPLTSTTVGWLFTRGYHREIAEYLTLFPYTTLFRSFWREMEDWLQEYRLRREREDWDGEPHGKREMRLSSGLELSGNGRHVFIIFGGLLLLSVVVLIIEVVLVSLLKWWR